MTPTGIDHIVLCVTDVFATMSFYEQTLGMKAREDQVGKWSLHFGTARISLQSPDSIAQMAKGTTPGSGNFCVVTEDDIETLAAHLRSCDVTILDGPGLNKGALGPMRSVYFNDPDGNLVEVCEYG